MKIEDGLVPDAEVRFVSIKDIVLIAGRRNNFDDGYCRSFCDG
jgi:hypothetical protein